MPDAVAEIAVATETPAEVVPTGLEAAREVSQKLLEQSLTPDQRKTFREERAAKKAVKVADVVKPAAEVAPTPAAKVAPKEEVKPDEPKPETIDFGNEDKPEVAAEETPEIADLTEDELAKLDEKARKRITDASKEAVKVRKRAQDAEAGLKAKDEALADRETKLAAMQGQLQEVLARGPALASNEFGRFTDGHQVAAWGTNAQEALALLTAHDRAVKAGRADADDGIIHTMPDGSEVTLQLDSKAGFERRVADAHSWFDTDRKLGLNVETAKKIEDRHTGTQGYKEALAAYTADPALHTRIPEMQRKAALYDTLMARKAMITFPDTAAGAIKPAPTTAARAQEEAAKKPAPLNEKSASAPRMASAMNGDDAATRKSEFMELARTAKDYDTQQKYLKQAAMIPSTGRTFAQSGSRSKVTA